VTTFGAGPGPAGEGDASPRPTVVPAAPTGESSRRSPRGRGGARAAGRRRTTTRRPATRTDESAPPGNVRALRPRRRRRLAQWPITIVLIGISAALLVVATDHFRRGSVLLSASVVLAFFLRLLLPEREAGMLAVRSRLIDLAVIGGLGLALSLFTFWVPAPTS
jgi:hypothetical protein